MTKIWKLLTLFVSLLLLFAPAMAEETERPVLQVHQMNIGCADGYLIRLGDIDLLIDGGNANPLKPTDDVVRYLRDAGVDKLDAYIVTHWHLDHCMNLTNVLKEFGTKDMIVYSPADRVPEKINNGTVTVKIGPMVMGVHQQMKMGDVIELGGMTITCVGPRALSMNGGCNSDSLNFVLAYGDRKLLFTGDYAASGPIGDEFRELCTDVDVLKFPHHGIEPYEITATALRVLKPDIVLVPGVINKYKLWNHADNLTVNFARENIYSNSDGHVVLLTDGGKHLEVLTQQNPADYAPQK